MNFDDYLQINEVVKIKKDYAKAKALEKMARSRYNLVNQLNLTKDLASAVFDNIYEGIKSYLLSKMTEEGYSPKNHKVIIAFSRDVLNLSETTVNKIDNLRKLRNDVVYRGKAVTNIDFLKDCLELLKSLINKS